VSADGLTAKHLPQKRQFALKRVLDLSLCTETAIAQRLPKAQQETTS
jgi:hypothetical protein